MRAEEIVWRTVQPLWRRLLDRPGGFERPAILRFAGDDFMEQLEAALQAGGGGLGPLVAGRETWRDGGAGLGTPHDVADTDAIMLFQPIHGRFYLVCASLVCRRYGHPDRRVVAADDETVTFVLRRLVPAGTAPVDVDDPTTFVEHGWVSQAWRLADAASVHEDEQRVPLFTVTAVGDQGPRRLLAGLVPVAGREALESSPTLTPEDAQGSTDPLAGVTDERLASLEALVGGLRRLHGIATDPAVGDAPEVDAGIRESLFFLLADLARWLVEHRLGGALDAGSELIGPLDEPFPGTTSWREAVARAREEEATATFEQSKDAPDPVAGLERGDIGTAIEDLGVVAAPAAAETALFQDARDLLPEPDTGGAVLGDGVGSGPGPSDPDSVYVLRCLYERPSCRPSHRQLVSRPSRPFRLAGFHEPDAPARPVRIALPVDPSPGGLRRFPKNVSVVLSNELRKQMDRISPDTLRDGSVGSSDPDLDFGMICQLSIPIITICALILLMVIVQLLNIVFFWLPLFKICLPIPRGE